MLRLLTAGESHGPCLSAIVEGMPAGVPLLAEDIDRELARRQKGYGRGGRMKIESDQARFTAGVRGGLTLGSPIALSVENRDWKNWSTTMAAGLEADLADRKVTRPRPGHADLTGALKYGHEDVRNVLERSSARETAARVAAGSVARKFLQAFGIDVFSHVVRIGSAAVESLPDDWESIRQSVAESPVSCACPQGTAAMKQAIDKAKQNGDSLGGVFEVVALNVPSGLGSYVQWDRKLDGRLAQGLLSIQAIKGVEFGIGFTAGEIPGSLVHDEIFYSPEQGYYRKTNRAGGIEGGMSNGSPIIVRAVMKPIPTLYQPLKSVDMATKEVFEASVERSDTCAVPAAAVVAEAVVAWELASALLEKFGGDTLPEIIERVAVYRHRVTKG